MKEDTIKWQDQPEPSPIKLILTLGIAGLLSGIAIVGIYEVTLPTITAYKAKVLREAVFKVLPSVTEIQKMRYTNGSLQADNSETDDENTLYAGYNVEGHLVGYAIPGEGPGFQDTIRLLYGYRPDEKRVVGMEILESRETPGLGDKIYKDADFVANFNALAVEPSIVMVKKGTKSAPNQVDSISGATISSKAVVKIINQTNEKWLERLSKK
jgi:Na+-translocating ferredoxin:NAD+ oxidoreductase subunit G